jgi:hypothetical protein
MEFGLVGCFDCYYCFCESCNCIVGLILILGLPAFWFARIIYSLFTPLGNGNLTHIEFPLPPIVLSAPYEPLPVAMMVGNCSEAKRCAYCHEEFDCNAARRFCFACKSATHEECAILNGGCSVFGCTDTTLLRQA